MMVGARPPVPSPVEFIVRRQAHAYLEPRKSSAITQIFPVGTHVFATGPAFDDADGARWMPVETYQSGLPGRKGKAFLLVRETSALPMPAPPVPLDYPGAPFPPPPPVYGRTRDRDATYQVGPFPVYMGLEAPPPPFGPSGGSSSGEPGSPGFPLPGEPQPLPPLPPADSAAIQAAQSLLIKADAAHARGAWATRDALYNAYATAMQNAGALFEVRDWGPTPAPVPGALKRFGRRQAPSPNALRILRNQGLQVRPIYARVTVLSNRGEANIYPTKEAAISVGFGARAVPLGSAPNGAYVRVLDGSDPDFWRVDYNGVQGWMRAQSVGRRTRLLTLA